MRRPQGSVLGRSPEEPLLILGVMLDCGYQVDRQTGS